MKIKIETLKNMTRGRIDDTFIIIIILLYMELLLLITKQRLKDEACQGEQQEEINTKRERVIYILQYLNKSK